MFTPPTRITGHRALFASAIALGALLAIPALPSGLSVGAPLFGAAFARHGADDASNDDGHHVGGHHRHGADDPADDNDDHPGVHQHRGGR